MEKIDNSEKESDERELKEMVQGMTPQKREEYLAGVADVILSETSLVTRQYLPEYVDVSFEGLTSEIQKRGNSVVTGLCRELLYKNLE